MGPRAVAARTRASLAALAGVAIVVHGFGAWAAEPPRIERIVLSSGGVGAFTLVAPATDADTVSITVPLRWVDDVLKSLTVDDPQGGVAAVALAAHAPLEARMRDAPVDLGALTSVTRLLDALRGAEVRSQGARAVTGRLLGVRHASNDADESVRLLVSVLTDAGLVEVPFDPGEPLAFVDPALQRALDTALAAIERHRDSDSRRLDIRLVGSGQRQVRIGYVVEAPLWKTSYRLVLGGTDGTRAHLHGWAHLENMTGMDWTGVELELTSGQPVTFRQAIYESYYVTRPEVPVEVMGRVLPRADTGAVAFEAAPAEAKAALDGAGPGPRREAMVSAGAVGPPAVDARQVTEIRQVRFRLPRPISLVAGHAVMVPISERELPVERIALYQPDTHARHPLSGLRIHNDTDVDLPPGVIAVYGERMGASGNDYVGDARLAGLPARDSRLLTFALDTAITVDRETKDREIVAGLRADGGVLELNVRERRTTTYRVRSSAPEGVALIVEQARLPGWTLLGDDAVLSDGRMRVRHQLPAQGDVRFDLTIERPRLRRLSLGELSAEQIATFATTGTFDEATRQAFARMAELRRTLADAERRLAAVAEEEQALVAEQERIRANLGRVPSHSDLYGRYLTKLGQQEDRIERLLEARDRAIAERDTAAKALSDYLQTLKL